MATLVISEPPVRFRVIFPSVVSYGVTETWKPPGGATGNGAGEPLPPPPLEEAVTGQALVWKETISPYPVPAELVA